MKRFIWIFGICAAIAAVVAIVLISQSNEPGAGNPADQIYVASEETGGIGEKVLGDPTKAKVVVYEYADYGCSHCADWSERLSELVAENGDSIAVVFRAYDLGFHNGSRVSAGATAAQVQGYWDEYKDLLFGNQAEWIYASEDKIDDLLVEYFVSASSSRGDVEQFRADLDSEAVAKRLAFENGMGKKAGVRGTPTFRIDGTKVAIGDVLETIEKKLGE